MYLALDTATDSPTLALGSPDEPGAALRLQSRRELSRDIECIAERLLRGRGLTARSLAGVVVADGPGSFTGLRIGIAFAKGLCRALDIPLLAAPSLMGAAWSVAVAPGSRGATTSPRPSTVLATYDALRGEVYRAVYRFDLAARRAEVVLAPELASAGAPLALAIETVRADASHASAAALLALLSVEQGAVAVDNPLAWEPAYGRLAEAEARHRVRHGRSPAA